MPPPNPHIICYYCYAGFDDWSKFAHHYKHHGKVQGNILAYRDSKSAFWFTQYRDWQVLSPLQIALRCQAYLTAQRIADADKAHAHYACERTSTQPLVCHGPKAQKR